jgi:wyosine [tRNA(Phe)-imidazoG37] synthetase (radical SAM superfamily)
MQKSKTKSRTYSYLFGPVPSRRLGMSLGVDLVPAKTCSMDCIYCESGVTTDFTGERDEFFPTADIIAELDAFLAASPDIDYITFSGAGEPTLHSGIGEIIAFMKCHYPSYKIALLTNAMMLIDKAVYQEVLSVDLIVPSLDSVVSEIFSTINRPVCKVDCVELVDTLARFKEESKALFYLEIFIVPGVNDTPLSIDLLVAAVKRIKPDKVQLNTLDRPGTESWVHSASLEEMEFFAEKIAKVANVEIVGKFVSKRVTPEKRTSSDNLADRIIGLISRRPCTAEDISEALNHSSDDLKPTLGTLLNEGKITSKTRPRGEFFKIN